jgi:hypothetical protein
MWSRAPSLCPASPTPFCSHLGIVNGIHPATAQGLATGLECVSSHGTVELIQVDEKEGT